MFFIFLSYILICLFFSSLQLSFSSPYIRLLCQTLAAQLVTVGADAREQRERAAEVEEFEEIGDTGIEHTEGHPHEPLVDTREL